ncbi:MAG: MarR family winged helix-turn-helix transcriptional regulator [Telluria sp.]
MNRTLGTKLRHLIDLLDGAVNAAYGEAGLSYRPRYTPVLRALLAREPATIGELAEAAGITQPAATQTVGLMHKDGLLSIEPGADARRKLVRLSPAGRALVPELERCWRVTNAASAALEAELGYPLSRLVDEAIAALEQQPFSVRLRAARASLDAIPPTDKEPQ